MTIERLREASIGFAFIPRKTFQKLMQLLKSTPARHKAAKIGLRFSSSHLE